MYRYFLISIVFCICVVWPTASASELFPQFSGEKDIQTFAGNWEVTLTNPETNEIVTKYMTLEPAYTKYCDPPELEDCIYDYRYQPEKEWESVTVNMTNDFHDGFQFNGNQMTFNHSYGTMGYWGAESEINFSGNAGSGRWGYQKNNGPETWKRAVPTIEKVNFFTIGAGKTDPALMTVGRGNVGRVTGGYEPNLWGPINDTNWRRPQFFVDIYGDNLWGFHVFDIKDGPEFDPRTCYKITGNTSKSNNGVIGLRCWVYIGVNVTNGRKTLRLDNLDIPFDLEVQGLPEEPQSETIKVKIGDLIIDKQPHADAVEMNKEKIEVLKAAMEEKKDAVEFRKRNFDEQFKIYQTKVKALNDKISPMRKEFSKLKPDESGAYRQKKDSLELEQRDYNRLYKIEKGRMDDAVTAYEAAETAFQKAYEVLSGARDRSLVLEKNIERELVQVSIAPAFLAKIHDREGAMTELNLTLKEAEDALYMADIAREKARLEMLFANDMLTIASENLVSGIYASTLSQTAVEADLQIKDALDKAKGGPGALAVWTTLRLSENVLNPPKIYEPDYGNDEKRVAIFQDVLDGYHLGDGKALETGAKYAEKKYWKSVASNTMTTMNKNYFQKQMQELIAKEMGMPLGSPGIPGIQKMYAEQQALFEKADQSLKDKSYRAGGKKFAAAWGVEVIKEQVKGVTVEALKRGLAEFFQGQAWRSYVEAEQDFGFAVRVFRMNGNIYWKNRDIVTGLKGFMAALESQTFDADTGFQFERNALFELKAGDEVWLFFTGDDADGEGGVDFGIYDGPVKVSLDGIGLARVKNSNRFRLTPAGYDLVEADHNGELTLKVVFE